MTKKQWIEASEKMDRFRYGRDLEYCRLAVDVDEINANFRKGLGPCTNAQLAERQKQQSAAAATNESAVPVARMEERVDHVSGAPPAPSTPLKPASPVAAMSPVASVDDDEYSPTRALIQPQQVTGFPPAPSSPLKPAASPVAAQSPVASVDDKYSPKLLLCQPHQVTGFPPSPSPVSQPRAQNAPQSPVAPAWSPTSPASTTTLTPQSSDSDNEHNVNGEDSNYELEFWKPRSTIALYKTIEDMEKEPSSTRQMITSFKAAFEAPLRAKEHRTREGEQPETTLVQLFWDKFINPQSTTWKDRQIVFTHMPRAAADRLMDSIKDASLRKMLREQSGLEGVYEMFSLIRSDEEAKSRFAEPSKHRDKAKFYAVLGGPGSGKSTVCRLWARLDPSVVHIAVGDILRAEADKPDSPWAETLKANLATGAIGKPEMTVALIKEHIRTTLRSATVPIRTWLLDGT